MPSAHTAATVDATPAATATGCPWPAATHLQDAAGAHAAAPVATPVGPAPADLLVLPLHQRVVVQQGLDGAGQPLLQLFCGDQEVSFDEPELFDFGRTLARQSQFRAQDATGWATGLGWPRAQALLAQLIHSGVLLQAATADAQALAAAMPSLATLGGARPSPLPPARCSTAHTWWDCEALTMQLTGRPLELGWLELVVPVFRVAHLALDADARQVGEANVFPPALRLDVPTTWRACIYPGTRFAVDRPMNVSALKTMRQHWAPMMVVLAQVRSAYLQRFPQARAGWTVGHLERLSTAVLALPTYLLMRAAKPVPNGQLHPVLSSLFRITDGLRMVLHQMLFVPLAEPTCSPDAPMGRAQILAYAERNHSFHSEHGVCAGPQALVDDFLAVLVDGVSPPSGLPLDAAVQQALDSVAPALDYALHGLRAYAVVFSAWPAMARSYETLADITAAWVQAAGSAASPALLGLHQGLQGHRASLQRSTYLGSQALRTDRERVYADMHAQCGLGLGLADPAGAVGGLPPDTLLERLQPLLSCRHALADRTLASLIQARFGQPDGSDRAHALRLRDAVMEHLLQMQAVLGLAQQAQQAINTVLGRAMPQRPFEARDLDIHNLLQGATQRHLPFLIDALDALLRVSITLDAEHLAVTPVQAGQTPSDVLAPASHQPNSVGSLPAGPRANRTHTTRSAT